MRYLNLILSAVLLSGCAARSESVAPGQYRNFHELSMAQLREELKASPAPDAVKDRYARCASAWVGQFIRPDEKARLDTYARGEVSLTEGEMQAIYHDTWGNTPLRHEMTSADVGVFDGLCTNEDIASFRAYKLPK